MVRSSGVVCCSGSVHRGQTELQEAELEHQLASADKALGAVSEVM
jgi:hypothetical protein